MRIFTLRGSASSKRLCLGYSPTKAWCVTIPLNSVSGYWVQWLGLPWYHMKDPSKWQIVVSSSSSCQWSSLMSPVDLRQRGSNLVPVWKPLAWVIAIKASQACCRHHLSFPKHVLRSRMMLSHAWRRGWSRSVEAEVHTAKKAVQKWSGCGQSTSMSAMRDQCLPSFCSAHRGWSVYMCVLYGVKLLQLEIFKPGYNISRNSPNKNSLHDTWLLQDIVFSLLVSDHQCQCSCPEVNVGKFGWWNLVEYYSGQETQDCSMSVP